MRKIILSLLSVVSVLSVSSLQAQTNIFFDNLLSKETINNPNEQGNYRISNILVPNKGWVLDTKWWGGIQFSTEGSIKLKSLWGTLFLSQGGNMGINTEDPSRTLTVDGDIYAKNLTSTISFQDDSRFTVLPSDVPGSISSSVSMPHYGILAPPVSGGAELWMSGFKGIRMFTAGQVKPKFVINTNGDAAFQGKLEAKEIKVTQSPTADFVFEENYDLPRLEDVEKHIKEKKHLPEIASAKDMETEGVNVGEFQIKLLQKIEELTLYSIELKKELEKLKTEISHLKSN